MGARALLDLGGLLDLIKVAVSCQVGVLNGHVCAPHDLALFQITLCHCAAAARLHFDRLPKLSPKRRHFGWRWCGWNEGYASRYVRGRHQRVG